MHKMSDVDSDSEPTLCDRVSNKINNKIIKRMAN